MRTRTRTTISPKAKQKFLDVLWDAYNEPSTTSTGVSNKSLKQKFPHYYTTHLPGLINEMLNSTPRVIEALMSATELHYKLLENYRALAPDSRVGGGGEQEPEGGEESKSKAKAKPKPKQKASAAAAAAQKVKPSNPSNPMGTEDTVPPSASEKRQKAIENHKKIEKITRDEEVRNVIFALFAPFLRLRLHLHSHLSYFTTLHDPSSCCK